MRKAPIKRSSLLPDLALCTLLIMALDFSRSAFAYSVPGAKNSSSTSPSFSLFSMPVYIFHMLSFSIVPSGSSMCTLPNMIESTLFCLLALDTRLASIFLARLLKSLVVITLSSPESSACILSPLSSISAPSPLASSASRSVESSTPTK